MDVSLLKFFIYKCQPNLQCERESMLYASTKLDMRFSSFFYFRLYVGGNILRFKTRQVEFWVGI